MEINKKIFNIIKKIDPNKLFFIAFALWLIKGIFEISSLDDSLSLDLSILYLLIEGVSILLVLLKITIFQKYTKKQLITILIVGILLLISTVLSRAGVVFATFLFIVAAKNIDINKVIALVLKIIPLMILIIFVLSFVGVIDTELSTRWDGGIRYNFGFRHINAFSSVVVQFCICWVWQRWRKISLYDYILLLAIAAYLWYVPNSRTSTIVIIILTLCMLFKQFVKNQKVTNIFYISNSVLCFIGSISIPFLYNHDLEWMRKINLVFSTRLSTISRFFNHYGFSIIGQPVFDNVETVSFSIFVVDNAFMYLSIRYGITVLFLYLVCSFMLMYNGYKNRNSLMIITIFIYMVFWLTEPYMFGFPYTFVPLLFADLLYSDYLN